MRIDAMSHCQLLGLWLPGVLRIEETFEIRCRGSVIELDIQTVLLVAQTRIRISDLFDETDSSIVCHHVMEELVE